MYSGCGGGGGTPRKSKIGTGYLARPKLGALKNIYTTKSLARPASNYGMDKRKKIRKPTLSKVDYRKKPNYADTAYQEAVSRLRILLAESYVPVKRPLRDLDSAGEETDNQSVVSAGSRASRVGHTRYHSPITPRRFNYYTTPRNTNYLGGQEASEKPIGDTQSRWDSGSTTAPPELMSFIERQEEYIEQMERESRFCREELSGLLGKVKDVISENENLHEKQKTNLIKSVFDHLDTETETETENEIAKHISVSPRHAKKHKVLEGPSIVFESRISELEAQLTQTKIDLKKAQDESETIRRKVADGGFGEGLDSCKKQVENLQREKSALQETVSKLQNALSALRDKENNTCDQVKRSLDVAEQAQYEKTAAEHEIRRLKDELERQHGKLRDAINEQSRRIADERSAVERRYTQQIEQLTTELGVQWEQTNKLQLDLDKQRRENNDLRRDIAQKQAHIDDLKKDMSSKITSLQSDIGVSGAEKSSLEQQIATLQLANERQERQARQETLRLQAEMQSLRQRLDRADGDLIHSRRENIRLTEQVAGLEKELKMNEALADERSKRSSGGGEIIALPPPKEDRERELTSMINDMETKHVATVAELEGMVHSQNQLMDKLSNECRTLTEKLEEANNRHKEEIRELQSNLDILSSRFTLPAKPSTIKGEAHHPTNIQGPTPTKSQVRTSAPQPRHTRDLSRTNSNASFVPEMPRLQPAQKIIDKPKPAEIVALDEPKVDERPKDEPENISEVGQDKMQSNYENTEDKNQEISEPPVANVNQEYAEQYVEDTVRDDYEPHQQFENSAAIAEDQQYENPEQYVEDPNQHYEGSEQYVGDPNQQYEVDPNQQYMSQEEYDQQYGQYTDDPNVQYEGQEYQDQQYQGEEYQTEQEYPADGVGNQNIDGQYTSSQYPDTQNIPSGQPQEPQVEATDKQ